jgi:hypothetical protein
MGWWCLEMIQKGLMQMAPAGTAASNIVYQKDISIWWFTTD